MNTITHPFTATQPSVEPKEKTAALCKQILQRAAYSFYLSAVITDISIFFCRTVGIFSFPLSVKYLRMYHLENQKSVMGYL